MKVHNNGVLKNSRYTVSADGRKVYFSEGNLQYRASDGAWRFAEHQYDIIGNGIGNTTTLGREVQSDWIDLLHYGANGINNGQEAYMPHTISTRNADYNQGCINGTSADFGFAFSATHFGVWRTLTKDEWEYLVDGRDGERFAKAMVHGVQGLIIIPDNRTSGLSQVNNPMASYTSNVIGDDFDNIMDIQGYAFLPCGGFSKGAKVEGIGCGGTMPYGFYHSSTDAKKAHVWSLMFGVGTGDGNNTVCVAKHRRSDGMSVRLVAEKI